jgi:hypothetical protein
MTELRSRRNQLILIVVALLAVLLLLGFWLQNSFSARISDLEKSQNAQQQEFSTELGDVKNKINSVTVDDREVGGDVAVVGGGDTTTNQNRTNTTQNDSTNVSSDVGSSQNGARGENGADGTSGTNGSDGAVGQTGPQGPSGVAACPNGNCLSLQGSSPGTQEPGSVNISGDGQFGGTVSAGSFSGDGANVTNVDATTLAGQNSSYYQNANNINSGTLSDGQLSSNVTLQGNTFNGASQLVQLSSGGILPMLDGSQLTNVLAANAMQLGGQASAYYLNASNLNAGTLSDSLLSTNVTLQGNTFNGANQLVKLASGGGLPILDGSQLTNVDAQTLNGQLAAYYLNASNINGGTLADARLSANVALKNATNTFTGTNNFAGVTATGILQNGYSVCSADNNCNYAATSGSANYIQNGTTVQTANFNVSGAGQIGGNLTVAGSISSPGVGANSEKFGDGATAAGAGTISIGYLASASVANSIAIGRGANVHTNGNAVAIGYGSTVGGNGGVAIGQTSSASGFSSTALGTGTTATGSGSVAVGAGSTAADYGVAIGRGSIASGTISVAIGRGAVASSNYTFVAGGETGAFDNVFFGKGEKSATPTNYTIYGTAGLGTNIQGGSVTIAGGRGTGSANGGNILFQTSTPGVSGAAVSSLSTKAQIGANGNATFGGTSDLGQLAVINDVAGEAALVVQGATSQSGDLLRLQDSAASSLFSVSSTGNITSKGNCTGCGTLTISHAGGVPTVVSATFLSLASTGGGAGLQLATNATFGSSLSAGHGQVQLNTTNGNGLTVYGSNNQRRVSLSNNNPQDLGARLNLTTDNSSTVGLIARGSTGQTADLLQVQSSAGTVLSKIDASGNLTVKRADIQGDYISFSNNIRGYNTSVTAATTTKAVTFGTAHPDANYAVLCTPNWNTTCFVSGKTTTGFTLNFGTAAPAGQLVDWFVAR